MLKLLYDIVTLQPSTSNESTRTGIEIITKADHFNSICEHCEIMRAGTDFGGFC